MVKPTIIRCNMKVTIEHKEQSSEDIFKPGSLVTDTDGTYTILVTGEGAEEFNFAGVNISDKGRWGVGEYDNTWDKDSFVKFVGTITLEQE